MSLDYKAPLFTGKGVADCEVVSTHKDDDDDDNDDDDNTRNIYNILMHRKIHFLCRIHLSDVRKTMQNLPGMV